MYCVNTTIADDTMDAKTVFFNEAMSEMVDMSCTNMVIHHGYTDPLIIPAEINVLRGKPATFNVTLKSDNTMTINWVNKSTTPTSTTPSKRKSEHPLGPETLGKQPKK